MNKIFPWGMAMLLLFALAQSCEEEEEPVEGEVHIYLLESFQTVNQEGAIDPGSVILRSDPLIPYGEIQSYDTQGHFFQITATGRDSITNRTYPVDGSAFAVVAAGTPVYTGYFWPSYSSAICQWVVIDPLMVTAENKLEVKLGYPGPFEGVDIPDKRNHPELLAIFRRDGKLNE